MQGDVRPVEDHEEWTRIVADADGGVFTMQGFMVHNTTKDRPVTERHIVEQAVEDVVRRKGWGELASVAGPMQAHQPINPNAWQRPDKKAKGYVRDFKSIGGWWLIVPVDYLDDLDDPQSMCFDVELRKRAVSLWAFEAYTERHDPGSKIPEFDYNVEYALKDSALYMYNDHPAAGRQTREFFGG